MWRRKEASYLLRQVVSQEKVDAILESSLRAFLACGEDYFDGEFRESYRCMHAELSRQLSLVFGELKETRLSFVHAGEIPAFLASSTATVEEAGKLATCQKTYVTSSGKEYEGFVFFSQSLFCLLLRGNSRLYGSIPSAKKGKTRWYGASAPLVKAEWKRLFGSLPSGVKESRWVPPPLW